MMLEWLSYVDRSIVLFFQELRVEWLNPIMKSFSLIGNFGFIWILICLALIITAKYRKVGIAALISLALCFIVSNLIIKNLVARPRPYDEIINLSRIIAAQNDYSFPSGHTCSSFAVAHTLFLTRKDKYAWLYYILAGLIALSRIYVGVHYPSDILAGIAIGIIGSGLTVKLLRRNVPFFSDI